MPLPPPIAVGLTTLPSHDCNYLPGRINTTRAFRIDQMSGTMYQKFMDAGFRRSGLIVYQPVCADCRQCVPIRISAQRFQPSKSQRRCERLNTDLLITESNPQLTDEKFELYKRYMTDWHKRDPAEAERDSLEQFLYQSPVSTIEFSYRTKENKLIGVGITDVCSRSLSSVYFYFDPAESARSLGTFSAIHEIRWCRRHNIEFYHLGFWIRGCGSMEYKSKFGPAEILGSDGIWRPKVESQDQVQ